MEIDENFKHVKWETFPCGHKIRRQDEFSELLIDLQAFHGVDARKQLEEVVEHERQKHLTGQCSEPQDDCQITSRPSDDGKSLRFFLTVNGKEIRELKGR